MTDLRPEYTWTHFKRFVLFLYAEHKNDWFFNLAISRDAYFYRPDVESGCSKMKTPEQGNKNTFVTLLSYYSEKIYLYNSFTALGFTTGIIAFIKIYMIDFECLNGGNIWRLRTWG